MSHLYIAYSVRDKAQFAALRDVLQKAGYTVWMDKNPRPDADWKPEVDSAIYQATAIIVIVTPNATESHYVTYEWSLALGMGKRIIPIFYHPPRDRGMRAHPRLRTVEGFDVAGFNDIHTFYDFFLRELRRLLATVVAPPSFLNPTPNPPADSGGASPAPLPYSREVMPTERGQWLVVRRGPMLNAMFRLTGNVITLGRDETNDITIADNEVSRYHLRLLAQGQGYAVEDLDSTNGTVVDRTRVRPDSPLPLRAGASLYLGDTIILSYEVV